MSTDSEYIDKDEFLRIPAPVGNLAEIARLIQIANASMPEKKYDQHLEKLDYLTGRALGLGDSEIALILEQFRTDPFLKRICPNMPHLGVKLQAYRGHYGRDGQRYL